MGLRRILYIEDSAGEVEVLTRLYATVRAKFHGECDIVSAPTWEEGVRMVDEMKPDVVIVDLSLPPTSNTDQTLDSVREKARVWPPIVVLTGNAYDLTLRRRAIEAGADDFMLKDDARHGLYESLVERVYHVYLRRQYRDGKRTRF